MTNPRPPEQRKTRDIVKGVETVMLRGGDVAKALAGQGSTKGKQSQNARNPAGKPSEDGEGALREPKRRKSVTFASVLVEKADPGKRKPGKRKRRKTKG